MAYSRIAPDQCSLHVRKLEDGFKLLQKHQYWLITDEAFQAKTAAAKTRCL
jgi:hypothetical protein